MNILRIIFFYEGAGRGYEGGARICLCLVLQ